MDSMNFGDWASLLSTVSVAIVVLLNMRNLSKPREDILVRLARIEAGVDGIQGRLDRIQNTQVQTDHRVNDLERKLGQVEESVKSAHKRIDTIEKQGGQHHAGVL